MKRVLKKVTAALLAATMVVGLAACGSGNGGSGNKSSKSGKVKIGVSIWSSTDVLGSQCKKMLDAAAKALDVEVQYVDQGHVSEKVTASVEQLAAAGCQGIIICNSSDTEMTSAIKTCNDNKVYLAQFFRVISKEDSADIYKAAKDSAYYIGAVHEDEPANGAELVKILLDKGDRNIGLIGWEQGDALIPAGGGGDPLQGAIAAVERAGKTQDIDIVSTDFLPDLGERLQNGSMAGESGGHFCDPLIAFMMVYNAVKGNYKDFAGKFEDVPFPYLYVSSADDYAAYEKYFVDQLPYTDDELVAMSKESLKELKATAASVSIADAESRAGK